jgi:ABC-type nitrate/sulfonate/bicarbonate transport system substrate-binding protein
MDRRTFIGQAAVAAASVAAFSPAARSQPSGAVPESTRLVLGFGEDLSFVPHRVALEKRWFRDAGFIEIVTRTFSDEALARDAFAAGELSIWTATNLPPVTMVHGGVPIVVLGTNAITATAPDKLVGPKDAKVLAPEDPYRIRIGQMSRTRSLLVASEAYVRRNPIATRQLVGTLLKAQRYVADPRNRDEAIELFCRETRQDKAAVGATWDDYVFDPTIDQAYVDDMKAITDYLVASGSIKQPKDPLDYTYSDPLAAADSTLVKVPGRFKP